MPHFLGVVRNRLIDIWHIDSNVVPHDDTSVGVLRRPYLDCQPGEEPSREGIALRIEHPLNGFIHGQTHSATSRKSKQARGGSLHWRA